jgi:hypothetical protein
MSDDLSPRIEVFNELVQSAENLLSIARNSDLQQVMLGRLAELSRAVSEWKTGAVAEGNESAANSFLGMECVLRALSAELEMWLMLKREEPERAWDQLIAAQTATCHAMRADPGFSHLDGHARRLEIIEKVVFPPQVFLSAGLIVSKAICTICGADYEECPHVVGMPYWGEFCFRKLTEVVPDHVAIVDDPANKRCRITHFSDEGGKRNRMTWRVEAVGNDGDKTQNPNASSASAIIMSADDLLC